MSEYRGIFYHRYQLFNLPLQWASNDGTLEEYLLPLIVLSHPQEEEVVIFCLQGHVWDNVLCGNIRARDPKYFFHMLERSCGHEHTTLATFAALGLRQEMVKQHVVSPKATLSTTHLVDMTNPLTMFFFERHMFTEDLQQLQTALKNVVKYCLEGEQGRMTKCISNAVKHCLNTPLHQCINASMHHANSVSLPLMLVSY